ncbi:MAG: YfhO family protein [Bacteroidales bacterium]|nr:YfhO family protein [Bacteroidales bacterium]
MQLKSKLQPYLPHLIAVVLFTVMSFAYFYPVLEGKVFRGNDSTVSKINSKEIQDYRDKFGKEPLWTNSIFSGMPAYLISTLYPGNLIKKADTILRTYGMPVSVLFLSMLGFYIMLILFGVSPWLAITGALAYGFTSFFFQVLGAGHNTQAIALAYMPPFIGGIYYAYRRDAIKGALLTAVVLALEIQANHVQITYYAMLCLLVFGIVEFIYSYKNKTVIKFLKTSVILILPFLIALGINFASLYTTYEYGKYSSRGKSDLILDNKNLTSGLDKDYILQWSYGVDETFNMLIPDYKGGSSKPFDKDSELVKVLRRNDKVEAADQFRKYWGAQELGTDGPHYVGAIVFFLFVLGLFLVKGVEKWWLLVATILSIMLAWGKNFMPLSNLFIDFFPGYNKFRAVTMILTIAEFCMPLLGILALRDIFNGTITRKEIIKGMKIAGGITGGFLILVLLIPGIAGSFLSEYETPLPAWIKDALVTSRKDLLRSDAFRSLVFILLSGGVILGFVFEKIRKGQAILVLTLLIVFDLWTVDKRYLNADRFVKPIALKKVFTPTAADNAILQDKSIFRVLNMTVSTFNDNSPTSYFHKSIGGYHGAKLKRYQELIDTAVIRNLEMMQTAFSNAQSAEDIERAFANTSALNMLNTKYLIYSPEAPPMVNKFALGNAWFAEKPVIVENANMEISSINRFNPAAEAIIDASFRNQISKQSYPVQESDKIELVSYQPDELVYKYSAGDEKLVVFSEIYYPAGWKSYIDGKETSYFRTNYVLRGMVVPAGNHEIKFSFRPSSYITGNKVSMASSILLILIIAGYFGSRLLIKPKTE